MVTGDFHHTAIAVARGVGMVRPGGQVVIIQAKSERQPLSNAPTQFPSALKSAKSLTAGSRTVRRGVSFAQLTLSPSAASDERAGTLTEGQPTGLERGVFGPRCGAGLTFLLDTKDEELDPVQALTMIAEVCTPLFRINSSPQGLPPAHASTYLESTAQMCVEQGTVSPSL